MGYFLEFNAGYIDPEKIVAAIIAGSEVVGRFMTVLLSSGQTIELLDDYDIKKLSHYLKEQKVRWQNDNPNEPSIPPYDLEAMGWPGELFPGGLVSP